jgi:SHS2 domain-containing protein
MAYPKFRIVKGPTSDVKFEAFGRDKIGLFENAALALVSVMCEYRKVRPLIKVPVKVKGKDLQDLLFNWLGQIIAQVDIEGMFFSSFRITKMTEKSLEAELWGDRADPALSLTVVKSVTYHEFSLEKTKEGYAAAVVLDI